MSDVQTVVLLENDPTPVYLIEEQPVVYTEGMSGAVSADVARANADLADADRIQAEAARDAAIVARNEAQAAEGGAEDARDDAGASADEAGTILDAVLAATGGSTFSGALTVQVATRAAMALLSGMSEGKQVFLSESGKIGLFVWHAANHSADVTADPYKGIWIAPTSAPTGASGAWQRLVDDDIYLTSWWEPPKDGTDAAPILNSAASAVSAAGGGTLKLERGVIYSVGAQATDVTPPEYGTYRFGPVTPFILYFVGCTSPIIVDLNGGGMRCRAGLKWGSFNTDGTVFNPTMPYFGAGISTPYLFMIRFKGCLAGQKVINGELDGNLQNLSRGGQWGDSGWQIPMFGIYEQNCVHRTQIEGVYSHHHGTDGCQIDGLTANDLSPDELVEITDCRFHCNTRQGMSVSQGTGIRARRSSFSWTGRTAENTNTVLLANTPGAGIDFESDFGPVREIYAEDCQFIGNNGPGVTFNGDIKKARFTRCLFIGTTTFGMWAQAPNVEFEDCVFVGAIANAFNSTNPALATKFRRCKFFGGTARSPTGTVYFEPSNPIFLEFGGSGAQNVLLDRCLFNTEGNLTARLGYPPSAIIRDCWMKQDGTADSFLEYCTFEGRNSITSNGAVSFFSSTNYGELLFNGVPTLDRKITNPIAFTGLAGPHYKADTTGLSLGGAAETLIRFTTDYATGGRKSISWLQPSGNIAGQVSVTRDDARNGYYFGIKIWGDTFGAIDLAEVSYSGINLVGGAKWFMVDGLKVLGARQAAIGGPTGGTVADVQSRNAIDSILATMRNHGLIAT